MINLNIAAVVLSIVAIPVLVGLILRARYKCKRAKRLLRELQHYYDELEKDNFNFYSIRGIEYIRNNPTILAAEDSIQAGLIDTVLIKKAIGEIDIRLGQLINIEHSEAETIRMLQLKNFYIKTIEKL